MRILAIIVINFYQKIVSPLLHQLFGVQGACRYPVTCSEYAKQSIAEYGILRGGAMAVKRLLSCNPFTKLSAA